VRTIRFSEDTYKTSSGQFLQLHGVLMGQVVQFLFAPRLGKPEDTYISV
jgi:hypothetical protein